MISIQSTIISSSTPLFALNTKQQSENAQSGSLFDALLSMGAGPNQSSASHASAHAIGQGSSVSGLFDVLLSENSAAYNGGFGFSSEFEAVFGLTGPLPDFINMVTSALHLSPEQNRALQDIAIRHKDATASAATVQSIAAELDAAGI
jgi:hypothetical protein